MFTSPSPARLGMSALKNMRQRLELVSIDVEEELLRLGLLLVAAMVAALITGMALLRIASAIVIYFWDSARWSARQPRRRQGSECVGSPCSRHEELK